MAINKVVYGAETLIDITDSTVDAEHLAEGYTAYDRSGQKITGVSTGGTTIIRDEEDSHGGTIRHITTNSIVSGTTSITSNGTFDVGSYASANVNVQPNLQSKSATPSETAQTILPDSGYDGMSQVNVDAISSNYVGTGVTRRTATALTTSGSVVSVPSGYYSSAVSKNIAAGTATTPAVTITTNPTISINAATGVITASYSGGSNITPTVNAGYISSGTAGRIATAGTVTYSLATQASQTITPTESEQTAVASGKYTTGVVKVGAISSTYVGSGIDRNDSTDLTVSGATVTVPSGYYSAQASKSVASGTAGTPAATKGTVSNHSVSVTPSVTNTTGYITGGTKTGTAVTVSASELVSGTKSITENGTGIDVTNYANVDVDVSSSRTYTATLEVTGSLVSGNYVKYDNVNYTSDGDTFQFIPGDTIKIAVMGSRGGGIISVDGTTVAYDQSFGISYDLVAPEGNIDIKLNIGSTSYAYVTTYMSITQNGRYDVIDYANVDVNVPSSGADVPVFETVWSSDYETTTVTCNKTFAECLAYCQNGVSWAYEIETVEGDEENVFEHALSSIIYSSQSITYIRIQNGIQQADIIYYSDGHIDFIQPSEYLIDKTITQNGFYSPSNGGVYAAVTVSVPSPSGTYNITSNGIYDVTNYASASVSVPSSVSTYTCTIERSDGQTIPYVKVNNAGTRYDTDGDTFTWNDGDTFNFYLGSSDYAGGVYVNGVRVYSGQGNYTYTPGDRDITLQLYRDTSQEKYRVDINESDIDTITITENGTYTASGTTRGYSPITVNVQTSGGFTANAIAMRTINGSIIGDIATTIGSYAFYYCSNLTTVSFPNATSIGNSAFYSCTSLTTANFPSVTSIGAHAFYYCSNLTTLSFPNATTIGSSAFCSCSNLTTASFPSVTSIWNYAFGNCSNLTTASFPSVTTIGSYAFYACKNLTTLSFPNATTIGTSAFSGCRSLTTASFPNVKSIQTYAFYYCSNLTTASFPSATSIGANAFAYCSNLTTLSFPNAKSIGTYAFAYCSNLTTASFPSVTSISSYAFYSCKSLTTASFPSVTSIWNYAFAYCYNFISLYLLGSSLCTNGGTSTFYSTPIGGNTTSTGGVYGSIFVPANLYDSYISATNWSTYSSRFVSLTDAEIEAILNE